ncbi:ubiquitin-conjugating enzyme family protein [Kriegella aquimaris]|uniref:Uncharacterized protein n=1 Tax=Kriegella aquimaris TaxID=192904 RepID=A0A1G9XW02_9FLAO|nr:hypothetical protein [Kriegella aquimaris]SDN00355.1 hypothetical protein SAMN04488514_11922 [Kriegella aquimaris]
MAEVGVLMDSNENWNPTDWACADARAEIKGNAKAVLKRGIDFNANAEINVSAAAHIAKFLALDVSTGFDAKIELKAQAQILLDLFDEVGVAIRLRAEAELAAFINVGIGINISDFLELAAKNPLMMKDPIQLELLRAILNEAKFQGGVAAKAAICAMAYANISCTGRLVSKGSDGAGFYLVGDYGVGLEAGAGIQMFIKVGLENPRRMIGNCCDIAVDNTLKLVEEEIRKTNSEDVKKGIEMLWGLRAPTKIAIRTAFEIGVALSEDPNFRIKASDVTSELAKRCVNIAIEEAQPYILELILKWAMNQLRVQLGFDEATWNELLKDTDSVANLLENMPDDPFGTEGENKLNSNLKYWSDVILGFEKLAGDVTGDKSDVEFYLSMVWGATQLSLIVSYYSKNKRSNEDMETTIEPIESVSKTVEVIPPKAVSNFILTKLNQGNLSKVAIAQLLQFISSQITEKIEIFIVPDSSTYDIFSILSGGEIKDNTKDVINQVINDIGSLHLNPKNLITIDSIQKGLKWYMTEKVEKELSEVLEKDVKNTLLKKMLNEVLIKSLAYTTDYIITTVRTYDANDKTLIREACSSVLMRLISRSLVVLTDELLAYTMKETHDTLEAIGNGVGTEKSNPIFNKLIKEDSRIDRAKAETLVSEMFEISSNVFSPIDEEKRENVRNLIYNLLDGMPNLDQLKNVNNFPGKDQLLELAKHNSEVLKAYVTEFAKQVLAKLGEFILQQITDLVESGKEHAQEWKKYLEEEINKKLTEIKNELVLSIAKFETRIEESIKEQTGQVNGMLNYVIQNKDRIKNELIKKTDAHFKAKHPRLLYPAASKALNIFETPLINIIVEACTQLKNKKDFLEQLQKSKSKEEIAEMLGNKLGELVAAKFKIKIATGKKREGWKLVTTYSTYGVPSNIVQSVFITLIARMEQILVLAGNLLEAFHHYSDYIDDKSIKELKLTKANDKSEIITKLQEKIPHNAQITYVAPQDKDLALLNADGKIQVQFENVPIHFFGVDSYSVSHVLIWVNNKLIGIEKSEIVERDGKVFVSIQLSPGPNIVCVRIIDVNIEANPLIVFVDLASGLDKYDNLDSWVQSDKLKWTDNATKKMEVQFENAEKEILKLAINDY